MTATDTTQPGAEAALDLDHLEALARAATPQQFDTAELKRDGGAVECPTCHDGFVDIAVDYCNYDGEPLGAIFYGIGEAPGAAEAFYRAANPAAVLRLVELARRATPTHAVGAPSERPKKIALTGGGYLRYEVRTTGEPGWLLHDPAGRLIRALNGVEVELVECAIAATQPASQACGGQVASAGDYVLVPRKLTDSMRRAAREKIGFTAMYEAAVEIGQVAAPATGAQVAKAESAAAPADIRKALNFAAGVIELFDDKTMEGDYMLDAGECAGIIRALPDYFDATKPTPTGNALPDAPPKFKRNDDVRKTKGSQWSGKVVGTYSTKLTPEGYCVESSTERGSVQIYPAAALELDQAAK